MPRLGLLAVFWGALIQGSPCAGAEVVAAVATNFRSCLEVLSAAFHAETGHSVTISSGSTGQLHAQILNGAPFTVFLAADSARPLDLENRGAILPGSRFTYAEGRLALVSREQSFAAATDPCSLLTLGEYARLAIANPELAPYGRAAVEALSGLGLGESSGDRLVTGQNVGQALQFVASGNAELGLVAWSQALDLPGEGWLRWLVPDSLHAAIVQQAVLLPAAEGDAAALEFAAFLTGPTACRIIGEYGYAVPSPGSGNTAHDSP
ncbi:MAG: molybdate ABC transporter substrate-binding protein [Candidatus Krumholzibacteriia bacterium]